MQADKTRAIVPIVIAMPRRTLRQQLLRLAFEDVEVRPFSESIFVLVKLKERRVRDTRCKEKQKKESLGIKFFVFLLRNQLCVYSNLMEPFYNFTAHQLMFYEYCYNFMTELNFPQL